MSSSTALPFLKPPKDPATMIDVDVNWRGLTSAIRHGQMRNDGEGKESALSKVQDRRLA